MRWTALVPLKQRDTRKSRLAEQLGPEQRAALSETLFAHVVAVLRETPAIERIVLLAPAVPPAWPHDWVHDEGRGLNAELAAFRTTEATTDLLILHADLPLVSPADLSVLLRAATRSGMAIAPDRHGSGTNALALVAGVPLDPRFGADSFERHRRQRPACTTLRRKGLALDIDTPEDLALAMTACSHTLIDAGQAVASSPAARNMPTASATASRDGDSVSDSA